MWLHGFTITDFIFALRDGTKAIQAGMDMEMPIPVHFGLELTKAVKDRKLSAETIDQAVLRVLRTQLTFKNTPDPISYTKDLVACPEHVALARRAAEESMVLIKNKEQALPLADDVKSLLVIGHLAAQANTGDHGSSNVYPPSVVTVMDGLKEKFGRQVKILHVNEWETDLIRRLAPDADAVLVVAGNDYNDEGEYVMPDSDIDTIALMAQGFKNNGNPLIGAILGSAKSDGGSYTSDDGKPVGGDRKSLSLRQAEIDAIRCAGELNSRTIVALVSGSMILTKEWEDSAAAILYSWYSGMEGGRALASVLRGDVNPSGKLPFVIPADEAQLPEVDFFTANAITYGFDHGYRKLDRDGNVPAYPFGFGLSYTTYTYGQPAAVCEEDAVLVTVPVKNTGSRSGDEIVQVYVSVPESGIERHVRELKGFARLSLAAGEEKTAEIRIPLDELKYYDEATNSWILEHTSYDFLAGPSADPACLTKVSLAI